MSSSDSTREWRWAMVASALIMLATSLPIIVGALWTDPAVVFSGTAYDRQDFAVHIATMRWADSSDWVYSLVFTTETAPDLPVKLAYVALGKLNALLGWNPVWTYHLVRVILGWGALLLIYALMRRTFDEIWNRRLAFLVASLASGLGWLELALGWLPDPGISPIDYWLSDAYVFYSLMLFPHFALVAICILGTILGYDRFLRLGDSGGWQITLVGLFVILAIQPFSIAIAYLCLGGLVIGRVRESGQFQADMIMPLVLIFFISLPLVWFNFSAFNQGEVWRSFSMQNITLSPSPAYYLMGVGILAPFALYGGWLAWRDRNRMGILAVVWLLGAGLLVYLPTQFQRRFSLFVTIPLAVLAVMALKHFTDRVGPFKAKTRAAQLVFLVVVSVSSIYLVSGGILLVLNQHEDIFDPSELIEALAWLDATAGDDQCVISSPRTGLVVPTLTDLRSYLAHPIETAFFETKLERLEVFFDVETSAEEGQRFLEQAGCQWVIVGPYEDVSADSLATKLPELELLYTNPRVTIFHWSPGNEVSR